MARKNPQRSQDHSASSLPSDRAFVVQFAGGEPDDTSVRGRAEHLVSGRASRFESWEGLRSFVELRLQEAARSPSSEGEGGETADDASTR